MPRSCRFRDTGGNVVVVGWGAGEVEGARRLQPSLAEIRAWLRDGASREAMIRLFDDGRGASRAPVTADLGSIADGLAADFRRGALRAYRPIVRPVDLGLGEQSEEPQVAERAVRHELDFVFQYPQGDPVEGCDYELIDPSGAKEKGTLGSDGTIHKSPASRGSWMVVLKEIDAAEWSERTVRPGAKVKLSARATGFADGASVKVRIFKEHVEGDADAIEELSGSVQGDRIEVEYAFDDAQGDRGKWQGAVALVAELSLEGGAHWAKTARPLAVELKTFAHAEWLPKVAHDGDDAELVLRTKGFDDGTSVDAELWSFVPEGDDAKLADLPAAAVSGGAARWKVPCRLAADWTAEDAKEAYKDGALKRPGEYYVVAKVSSPVARELRSRFLQLEWSVG